MIRRSKIKEPGPGAIVVLPLSGGRKGYARLLKKPLMAFYAVQSDALLSIDEILKQPVAFKVWVMSSAITSGRWTVIGCVPLGPALEESPWFFKQDAISKALSIYRDGVESPATKEQCEGLECAAVWSAQHVESRLEDYFEGRSNKWLDALKLKG